MEKIPARAIHTPPFRSRGMSGNRPLTSTGRSSIQWWLGPQNYYNILLRFVNNTTRKNGPPHWGTAHFIVTINFSTCRPYPVPQEQREQAP